MPAEDDRLRCPRLRPPDELADRLREPARAGFAVAVDAGRGQQRLQPGTGLKTAARATRAREPIVLDGGVAELAAEPAVAAEQLAAEHEPAADPDLARAVHEVADAGGHALPQLGERGQVGLVVEPDLQVRR